MEAPEDACACVPNPAESTPEPCWTCPAGLVHWYDIEGMAQPEDRCACVAPTTSTPEPCWTCPAGFKHWYEIEGMEAPEDKCACVAQQRRLSNIVKKLNL
jgi:homoserine trans-succinylase